MIPFDDSLVGVEEEERKKRKTVMKARKRRKTILKTIARMKRVSVVTKSPTPKPVHLNVRLGRTRR